MKILRSVTALALCAICSIAMAQWQWLDKDGRKVFSDRSPPPDVMEKDILKRPTVSPRPVIAATKESAGGDATVKPAADGAQAAVRSAPLPGVDKDLEAKMKQAAEAEASKRRAEDERVAKAKVENCARAKQARSNLEAGLRISRTNATGEREVLDDAARASELKRVQSQIDNDCK